MLAIFFWFLFANHLFVSGLQENEELIVELTDLEETSSIVTVPYAGAAEVTLMAASERAEHEVSQVTELGDYINYLPRATSKYQAKRPMRFENYHPFDVTMWWDDGSDTGVYSGVVPSMSYSGTNTFISHAFIFKNESGARIGYIKVTEDTWSYIMHPDSTDTQSLSHPEYLLGLEREQFRKDYIADSITSSPWTAPYPPKPVSLYIWPADFIGQTHKIKSKYGYYLENGMLSEEEVELELQVISISPRALVIQGMLSPYETQHIIDMGIDKLAPSSVCICIDTYTI